MTEHDENTTSPIRLCSKCSTQASTSGAFCPHCGSSYARRQRPPRRALIVAAAVLAIVATGGGVALGLHQNGQAEEQARQDRMDAAAERREAAAVEAADDEERERRAAGVRELEQKITAEAREQVADGLLEGPIKSTTCIATGEGSTDDLTQVTGTFECLAVTEEGEGGTARGHSYDAVVNWDDGSAQWGLQS